MEKFTNPKRGNAPSGCIRIPLRYLSTSNEQLLPLLLMFFFTLLSSTLSAQYTFAPPVTSFGSPGNLNSLNVISQGGYSTPTLVDLNGDGKLDIVTGAQNGQFYYFVNNGTAVSMPATPGTPSWTLPSSNPFSSNMDVGFRSSPTFVDIDGDGDLDMFSGNSIGEFWYYKNTGSVTTPVFEVGLFEFNPMWFEDPLNPGNYLPHNIGAISTIGFFDADAIPDGDFDVVAGNSQGQFFYFENEGDMFTPYFPAADPGAPRVVNLRPSPQILQGSGNSLLNATVGMVDMNCDGIYDVLSGTRNGTFQFRALETIGANGYDHRFNTVTSPPTAFPLSSSDVSISAVDYSYPAAGDLDGDGDIDFISGRASGTFVYFQNTTCNTAPTFSFGSGPGCGGTYVVNLTSSPYTLLPSDIGNPTAVSTCPAPANSATVMYDLATVSCSDVPTLVPVSIRAVNTVTGVKSAPCTIFIDVNDNVAPAITPPIPTIPPNAPGNFCSATPYYIDLDANGTATMGTVNPNNVPQTFTDICPLTYSVLAQPPAAFQFNCNSITLPPFIPPNNVPYQIILQATDNAGNTGTCISNIIIRDVTPPVVTPATLPNESLSICTSQAGSATFTTPTFTVTDNCLGSVTQTATISPTTGVSAVPGLLTNGPLPQTYTFTVAGTYTITYTFTDNATPANVTTRTQTIVVANTPLYFNPTCPPNQILSVNPATACSAPFSWTTPIGLDCSTGLATGITTIGTRTSPHTFPVGTETVVYTATNGVSSIQCYFTVTVQDNVAPIVGSWNTNAIRTLPTPNTTIFNNDVLTFNMGSTCGVVVNWIAPASSTVTDNCTTPTLRVRYEFQAPNTVGFLPVTGYGPGSIFPAGTTRVIYDYVDAVGNASASTFVFDIVVEDHIFPSITCPNPITTVATQGFCYADVFLPKPSGIQVSDNCGTPTVAGPFYGPPAQNFPIGSDFWRFEMGTTNPVNFTATDASGNTSTCTMTVTVIDNQKPVFSNCVTADVIRSASPLSCTVTENIVHPTVMDNSVSCTIPGALTYTLKITGATVLAETPVLSAGTLPINFNEGVSRVRYLVKDAANNVDSCVYLVKVTNTVAPSFTNCPSFQGSIGNLPTDPGQCYLALTATSFATQLGAYGGGPGCDPGTFAFTRLPNTPLPLGSQLGVGTHILKVVATDYSGNTASCQFSVTIQDLIVPTTSSTICGSTLNFNTDLNQCSTIPNWNAPGFMDNCGVVSTTVTYVNPPSIIPVNYISGSSLSKGTYIFTYTARDAANNPGFCTFTVNIIDAQKPNFTNCPVGTQFVDVGAPGSPAFCGGIYTRTLTATDNCPGVVAITPSASVSIPVDLDPLTPTLSTYTVTYTATDVALSPNNNTCVITVQARDVSGPVVAGCPSPVTLTIGSPLVCTLPHPSGWADPNFSSFLDCTGPVTQVGGPAPTIISQNLTPVAVTGTSASRNAMFPTGVNTVTYTYRDGASPANTSTCTFTVTVIEGVPPVFVTCPSPITVSTEGNTCARNITTAYLLSLPPAQRPSATDLCSPSIEYTTSLPALGTSVPAGSSIPVIWSAKDNSNNTNAGGCVQTIVVQDQTDPVFTPSCPLPPYTVTLPTNASCIENGNNGGPTDPLFLPPVPTVTDNCGAGNVSVTRTPGQPGQYCVGQINYLQWTATDVVGRTSTCEYEVIVQNTCQLATLNAVAGVEVNLGDLSSILTCCTNASISMIDILPNSGFTVTSQPYGYTFSVPGTYAVTYTVTCGNNLREVNLAENSSTLTFTRTVIVTPPNVCTPATPSFTSCPTAPITLTDVPGCPASVTTLACKSRYYRYGQL
ncbi:MAG: HYR domain-containing protein [Lewinellaceae bacterium]|nr:HYR domain-containing protein [Lewinellaceae bacterium]